MPNIAFVLREEINRLARKEIRQQVGPLKKTNSELRRTVTALKNEVTALRRGVRFLEKQEKRRLGTAPKASAAEGVRFAARWVKADRDRLGLSAKNYGHLVGVAGLTIYSWEKGKSKPRDKQLAAWAKVRGIGKREAWQRLELLGDA